MSFLTPWIALWLASAVIPVLLILYFLKLRRREEAVASTLLWKRAVQDLQVNAPFQRLRKNLLLLLQLLILSAALFALARPVVETALSDERSLIILIDRSASMNTQEMGGTRLELAKEQAKRLVQTLNQTGSSWLRFAGAGPKTRAMVITFADRASVVSPFTTNTSELESLIDAIQPTDATTNMAEALELAEAYMTQPIEAGTGDTPITAERESKVVLYSDGAIADARELFLRHNTVEFIPIGEAVDNVGITALRAQRNYEQPEMVDTFLRVENFGPTEVRTDVSILVDGTIRGVETVTLPPGRAAAVEGDGGPAATQPAPTFDAIGSARAISFPLTLDRAGLLTVRLSRSDALPTDNESSAVIPPPRKLRVLLVSKKNFFLESVVEGLPLEEVIYLTPEQYEKAPAGEIEENGYSLYDVVLIDKYDTARLPVGNYLFFGGVPKVEAIKSEGEVEGQALMWWDETHPVLRNVELEYVQVASWLDLKMPEKTERLIEGPTGPVLARYSQDARQYLILAFAVENSTWWQNPSFPMFVYNAIRFLGGASADSAAGGGLRPGETLRASLPAGVEKAHIETPGAKTAEVIPDETGVIRFGGTHRAGLYTIKEGAEGRDRFAVNLEDAWESNIAPRRELTIGGTEVTVGEGIAASTPEVWRWFVGAALFIAFVEWYIYNRRVFV